MRHSVEKKTGTYADTLHAIGLATLFADLGLGRITLRDEGGGYSVSTSTDSDVDSWPEVAPGYPYIWEKSKPEGAQKPVLDDVLDYEAAKLQNERWKQFQKSQPKAKKRGVDIEGMEAPEKPPQAYFVASLISSMRSGWNADRHLARWIEENPGRALNWVKYRVSGTGPAVEEPTISNSQVFNPIGGKGIHGSKTLLGSAGSLPNALIDPFAEWMKFRGLWASMILYRGDGDFKFFALEPADIPLDRLRDVKTELQSLGSLWGNIRLDIRATLECARILLRHSDGVQAIRGRTPRAVITGLRLAYFKSLGKGAALMNESLLPLPAWFQVRSREDADSYLAIITEIIGDAQQSGCLATLQESHSDDGETLQQYRRWLLTGELTELLDFQFRFALHVMQRRSQQDYVREFSTSILDVLFGRSFPTEPGVREIIENEGFKSVARAIRDSTIYAMREPRVRTVHFGLAQKWKQKIKSGDADFLSALSEFVQEQNWEVLHRLKARGHVVLTSHLDEIVTLTSVHHAELVGSLLLAYGYSRTPPKKEDITEDETK